MSRVWFTSDLHLGHERVAAIRGFDNPAHHDEEIIDMWWETVGERDQVWVLGDVAVGQIDWALEIVAGLPGEKHLIWGNHDAGHPMHRQAHRKGRRYTEPVTYSTRAPFASAQAFARRKIAGVDVLLSHFPYQGDTPGRDRDRFPEYRLRNCDMPLLHGHTHSSLPPQSYTWPDGGPQFHVGLDAHDMKLVPLDRIEAWLRSPWVSLA